MATRSSKTVGSSHAAVPSANRKPDVESAGSFGSLFLVPDKIMRGRVFVHRNITYTMAGSVSLWSHASSLSLGGGTITPQQNLPPPLQLEWQNLE
jgi:hypothetical protein